MILFFSFTKYHISYMIFLSVFLYRQKCSSVIIKILNLGNLNLKKDITCEVK